MIKLEGGIKMVGKTNHIQTVKSHLKERYKMYKFGSCWTYAALTSLVLGVGLLSGSKTSYADTAAESSTPDLTDSISTSATSKDATQHQVQTSTSLISHSSAVLRTSKGQTTTQTTEASQLEEQSNDATQTAESSTPKTSTSEDSDSVATTNLGETTAINLNVIKKHKEQTYKTTNQPQVITATAPATVQLKVQHYPADTTLTWDKTGNPDGWIAGGSSIGNQVFGDDVSLKGTESVIYYYQMQDWQGNLVHNPSPDELYLDPAQNQTSFAFDTASADFYRTVSLSPQTGQITYSDWQSSDGKSAAGYAFPEVTTLPYIPGYQFVPSHSPYPPYPVAGYVMEDFRNQDLGRANNNTENALHPVGVYVPVNEDWTVTFIDQDTGATINQLPAADLSGTPITPDLWSPDEWINVYKDQGYQLVCSEYPTDTWYIDFDPDTTQNFNIYLKKPAASQTTPPEGPGTTVDTTPPATPVTPETTTVPPENNTVPPTGESTVPNNPEPGMAIPKINNPKGVNSQTIVETGSKAERVKTSMSGGTAVQKMAVSDAQVNPSTTNQQQLPQTNEQNQATVGFGLLGMLTSLLGAAGLKRRKRNDE